MNNKKIVIGRDDLVTCKKCGFVFSEMTWGDCPFCRSKEGRKEFVKKFNEVNQK